MQNTTAAHAKTPATSPLERLSALVDGDMQRVNALIIENMQSDVPLIPKLAEYLIAAGGKRIRPLMTLGAASLFNADMDKAAYLAAAVEFIHTATLLHDDVVDESTERRGQKAANLIFGNQASVLVGDFLFSRAFQMMIQSGSLDILRILSDASAVIAQGEVLQLCTANDVETGLDAYVRVIECKTASLFAAACEIGPVLADASPADATALRNYGMNIGTAFQIIDDALDYAADHKKLGKSLGDDFREGKMTAPVIFAIQNQTPAEKEFWTRTLAHRKQTDGDFAAALEIITAHKALDQTLALAKRYAAQAQEDLRGLPQNDIQGLFHDLADYTVSREL